MTRREPAPERQSVSHDELTRIVERASSVLGANDAQKLRAVVDTLAEVTRELERTSTSLERVRALIFGGRTETTAAVLGDGATDKEDGSTGKKRGKGNKGKKKGGKRKGHGRNGTAAYPRAPHIEVPHATLKHRDPCPECERGKLYRQRQPKVLVRVTGVAPLRATVYELKRLRCNLCGEVFTAASPEGVGREKYDETAASMIGLLKYGCGLPFNRIARLERNLSIPLPASTQWEVVERAAAQLEPAYEELVRQAAQGEVVHNDDTPMKILELTDEARAELLPGDARDDRTGVFTSGIASIVGGHRIALFATGPKHAGENLADVLAGRDPDRDPPIQMSDALSRNAAGEHETVAASCLAHARRKYVEVASRFPDECRYVLETLREVYRVDGRARTEGLDAEQRLELHKDESAEHMESLERWMEQVLEERRVEPNSPLGEAIRYMQKHWEKLTLFLRVPGAPLDNNLCERSLKKAILHRKNALFYKTTNGARVGDVFMSLIHTAELCDVAPFDYLVALQRHVASVLLDPAAWMPWNYTEALTRLEPPAPQPAR